MEILDKIAIFLSESHIFIKFAIYFAAIAVVVPWYAYFYQGYSAYDHKCRVDGEIDPFTYCFKVLNGNAVPLHKVNGVPDPAGTMGGGFYSKTPEGAAKEDYGSLIDTMVYGLPFAFFVSPIMIWYVFYRFGFYFKGMMKKPLKFAPNISVLFAGMLASSLYVASLGYFMPYPISAIWYWGFILCGLVLFLLIMKKFGELIAKDDSLEYAQKNDRAKHPF